MVRYLVCYYSVLAYQGSPIIGPRTEQQKMNPVKIYYDFMCGYVEYTANRYSMEVIDKSVIYQLASAPQRSGHVWICRIIPWQVGVVRVKMHCILHPTPQLSHPLTGFRFHAISHANTCSGWLLHKNDHRNTEIAEQANSILAGISPMLGRCGWIMGNFNIALAVACFNHIRNMRFQREQKELARRLQRLPPL